MSSVAVTGATGFIGRPLCQSLTECGYSVTGFARSRGSTCDSNPCRTIVTGDLLGEVDWNSSLRGIDCVVHLAARVHVMGDDGADSSQKYDQVNAEATRRLAEAAASVGVRRFIFMSTIKVLGEATSDSPYRGDELPNPADAYSRSKLRAEKLLRKIEDATDLEVVVIRPPLVYGPGVKGNLQRLLQLVCRQIPLPFAGFQNSRSMVGIENLCDLIRTCINDDRAAGNSFLVSDNMDVSTPDLVRLMGSGIGVPVRLFSVPKLVLEGLAGLVGREAEIRRLSESLVVDCGATMRSLEWTPRVSLQAGMAAVCAHFMNSRP